MLEANPCEAALNNIHGTRVLAEEACRAQVERFVFISTDKAVNPVNIMGATKRVAELYCRLRNDAAPDAPQGSARPGSLVMTRFIITRFGNVLDSAGSVVPIFRKQIAAGGPVTVTHKKMTRYFMTIPEAVGLILQAGGMGQGGEIFVLDMGKPVRILDLAKRMVRLASLGGAPKVEITITGLRPGEKLTESLFHEHEKLHPTAHQRLNLALCRAEPDPTRFITQLDEITTAARAGDSELLIRLLQEVLPGFIPTPPEETPEGSQ
jgi:FlaA1/EpsC-like NDP-sugar epimerase